MNEQAGTRERTREKDGREREEGKGGGSVGQVRSSFLCLPKVFSNNQSNSPNHRISFFWGTLLQNQKNADDAFLPSLSLPRCKGKSDQSEQSERAEHIAPPSHEMPQDLSTIADRMSEKTGRPMQITRAVRYNCNRRVISCGNPELNWAPLPPPPSTPHVLAADPMMEVD